MVPRLRTSAHAVVSGVPVELLDAGDPVWESKRSAAEWFDAHGLVLRSHPAWWGSTMFHAEGVRVWALANGFTLERWPAFPDWGRLRDAGVPVTSTSRMRWAGLKRAGKP